MKCREDDRLVVQAGKMRVPFLSITYLIAYCTLVSASTFSNGTASEFSVGGRLTTLIDDPDGSDADDRAPQNSAVGEEASWGATTFVSAVCQLLPDTCGKMRRIFFNTGKE